MTKDHLWIGLVCGLLFFVGLASQSHAKSGWVPPNVLASQRALVADIKKDGFACSKPKAILTEKFTDGEITNDVFILSTEAMGCEGFSGSAGSLTQIWIDGGERFVKLYDGYARGWEMRPGMVVVAQSGYACGQQYVGATPCEERITWGEDYKRERWVEDKGKWKKVWQEKPGRVLPFR